MIPPLIASVAGGAIFGSEAVARFDREAAAELGRACTARFLIGHGAVTVPDPP